MAGGYDNAASGGQKNRASSLNATVAGGAGNAATDHHATVGGGSQNAATGVASMVGGGINNRAQVDAAHDGSFLYADATEADFFSAAADEFAVRASGGCVPQAEGAPLTRLPLSVLTGWLVAGGLGTFAAIAYRWTRLALCNSISHPRVKVLLG